MSDLGLIWIGWMATCMLAMFALDRLKAAPCWSFAAGSVLTVVFAVIRSAVGS